MAGISISLGALVSSCSSMRPPAETAAACPPADPGVGVDRSVLAELQSELVAKAGESEHGRVERGLRQAASLWRAEDGDFAAFVRESFVADQATLAATLSRLESVLEQVSGHTNEISRELRWAADIDVGPLLPVDTMFAGMDPGAHFTDDLFASKIGFFALLNYPQANLAERTREGDGYSRQQWAELKLTDAFALRVPAEVRQEQARVAANTDLYVAQYNIWMHHLLSPNGERLFPKGLRLISHWNLRDELKADYADPRGLDKQRLIARVMERIVTQTIPKAVIDNPYLDWDPATNQVSVAPSDTVEAGAPARDHSPVADPEPNTRYQHWREQFLAARRMDAYSPIAPTAIARSFELGRALPEDRVVAMLTEIASSPLAGQVAAVIERELMAASPTRRLEPHDLWYNGFQARGRFGEAELDKLTRARYPNAEAFQRDIPRILAQLGFSKESAEFISAHIVVDPARGAGHAMPALRRGDLPRLRTRIEAGGMSYKAYNIAVHELGHNVEEVISLYKVDRTLLAGIPNTAFTEAFAFLFQARDLELLGLSKPDAESERRRVLNDYWMTYEIAGVGLLDVAVWHWLYDHPGASAAELREAVERFAKEIWNRYYAPVLGGKDSVLLAIYSHLIAYPLYVSDYALGHIISFQIEERIRKAPALGPEFERMAAFGAVTPDVWMRHATDEPVNAKALLSATEAALRAAP